MRNGLVAFAVALVACSAGPTPMPPKGTQLLAVEGSKVEHGPFRFGTGDVLSLPHRKFKAQAPATSRPAEFDGLSVATLLADRVALARDADTAVFYGHDGLAVAVPLAAVRQLKPVLAYRVDGAPVEQWQAPAAPLQLAWPNVEQPGIDTDPRMRWWWVPGVTKISVHSWVATYGRALRVPPGASDEARLGADSLQAQCLGCHRVRGVGGTRGPELNDAFVHTRPEPFQGSFRDHLQKVSGVSLAGDPSQLNGRQIASFLHAVELAGTPPDEIKPPEPPQARPHPTGGY
jgi:hypothetical protein